MTLRQLWHLFFQLFRLFAYAASVIVRGKVRRRRRRAAKRLGSWA